MLPSNTYPSLSLFIDGEWIRDGERRTLPVQNPATGEVIAHVPVATESDIDAAIASSRRGFEAWRRVPAVERAKILCAIGDRIRKDADALATILTLEQGKRLPEALQEIHNVADTFQWMAEEGRRAYGRLVPSNRGDTDQLVRLEPIGPVAGFSPWNFPAILSVRKVATALAAGCSIVLKPAEETPGIMLAIAHHCHAAGLPRGVLNILYGVPSDISSKLIESPVIRKASFTGSVEVGRHLATLSGRALKKITLELGGHAPVIVTEDIDVERVVALSVAAKFRNAGQLCLCPTRFIVHQSIYEQFLEGFASAARQLKVGPGLDPESQMGPLANERRLAAMEALCEDATSRGARIVAGGHRMNVESGGFFWAPTVITDLPNTAEVMTQEPFGPIALIIPYKHLGEAIAMANAVDYGLASYAFTNSLGNAHRLETELEAGSVSINTFAISPPEMPFGGVKNSGVGTEMGKEGLMQHFHAKAVVRASKA